MTEATAAGRVPRTEATSQATSGRRIDPVTASVIHGALQHIAVIKVDGTSSRPPARSAQADQLRQSLVANGGPND